MTTLKNSLLNTKIHIPVLRRELINRPRLLDLLDSGLEKRLTLLSAPAGYGKTTLLCEWIAYRVPDEKLAWLSLDDADNEPTIFLQHVIAALQVVDAEIGQSILPALQAPNHPEQTEFLPPLINQINQGKDKVVLVLDDYHLITEQSIHGITRQFIEQCPAGLHVVIATRADPPLPLYRYRAQGDLNELRQKQLSFTLNEARELLLQIVGDVFQSADIELLHQRTEGWAVGLLLAGLSLQESGKISESIALLSGNQSYIMEYLVNEVLDHQPKRIREFLLKTSILKKLTGPLCDRITGFEDGYQILEWLKAKNLFIIALDNEQVWYRYHQLFTDLLRRRLERDSKDILPQLHKTASDWYAQNGYLVEAIDHAVASGDYSFTSHLIEGSAEKLWSQGEQALLLKQLQSLPLEIIHTSVPVCLWYSLISLFAEQHRRARELLQAAEELIQREVILSSQHREKVLGVRELHSAYLALLDLDLDRVIRHAQQALEHLPGDWQTLRQITQMLLADACNWQGNAFKASQMYSELLETNSLIQNPYLFFTIGIRNALLGLSRGQLQHSYNYCLQSLQQLGKLKPRLASFERFFSLVVMDIFVERNNLDEVRSRLDIAFEQFKDAQRSSWDLLYLSVVRGYIMFNNTPPARHILSVLEDGIRSSQLPRPYLRSVLSWKARIHLIEGNTANAADVLSELGQLNCDRLAYQDESAYFATIRVWLAQGKFEQTVPFLEALQTNARQGGRINSLIETLILHAVAEASQNHEQNAQQYLSQAITLAESEGFVRIFIEGGPVILNLLGKMVSTGHESQYIIRLIEAFGSTLVQSKDSISLSGFVESFSERELQVLRFLRTHLSQQEIAEELNVSVNTIRFHTKNIYGKLGVHDRSGAVRIAEERGLL